MNKIGIQVLLSRVLSLDLIFRVQFVTESKVRSVVVDK